MLRSIWLKPVLAGYLLGALASSPGAAVWACDPGGAAAGGLLPQLPLPTVRTPVSHEVETALALHARGHRAAASGLLAHAVLSDPRAVEPRLMLAALWIESEQFEPALLQLDRVRAIAPSDPRVAVLAATANAGLAETETAIAEARIATRLLPIWPEAHLRLGHLLMQAGRIEEGQAAVLAAVSGPAVSPEALYDVGNMFLNQGAAEAAVPFFERALAWRPTHSYAANNLGNALKALDRHDEAKHAYERAIAADPDNPNPHNALGVMLAEDGDEAGAMRAYEAALKAAPHYVEAYYNAGMLLLSQKKLEAAADKFSAASRLNPGFALAHLRLGEALWRLGQRDRARASIKRATMLDPEIMQDASVPVDVKESLR